MVRQREALRWTFGSVAARYQRARPDYPVALYDELERAADLQPGDHLLEIGCGTGKATMPLAQRGYAITCIELGRELSREAQRNLEVFPEVEVVHASFEEWEPSTRTSFDLVRSDGWHWIDPEVRYRKAARLLCKGGHLAFWTASHVFPEGGDPFFREIQPVYDDIGESLPLGTQWTRPDKLTDDRVEIEASGLFDEVIVRRYDWEVAYDANGYLDLLDSFSGHIAMQAEKRERLYAEIRRRLGARPDGLLRRHWGTVRHVARRRD